jgi:hypothetical protein
VQPVRFSYAFRRATFRGASSTTDKITTDKRSDP